MREDILTLGIMELSKEKFNSHANATKQDIDYYYFLNKPFGSLWGSTFTPSEEFCSDWDRWCTAEQYEMYVSGVLYTLKESARIYTIDSIEDFIFLLKKYPLFDEMYIHCNGHEKIFLNYSEIIKDFDAIHLTHKGNNETHLIWDRPEIKVQGKTCTISDLNAWDVESWCILNFDVIDLDSCRRYDMEENKK